VRIIKTTDDVNHPDHYKVGGLETIEILEKKLTNEEFKGFLKGNVIKYITRGGHKEDALKDFKKCKWYLDRLVSTIETV
jgi:hypothetical protein|tara:strand:+ start:139 stop:375 length:237 start_codon:yes stop_codon:yes gene_type:complete